MQLASSMGGCNAAFSYIALVPDTPPHCKILNNKIVNDVDNISFELEWPRPQPNGILILHYIKGECYGIHDVKSTRYLPEVQIPVTSDAVNYKYNISGLPNYSICTVYIAGATMTGVGEFVSCSNYTPLTGINPFSLNLLLHIIIIVHIL